MASSGAAGTDKSSPTLLDLLSTAIVLDHLVAYLPLPALFAVSATSQHFQSLILQTPAAFRYVDLSKCRGAQVKNSDPIDTGGNVWRSERMDEALTEDEFYSGPLRGIFSNLKRRKLLQAVQVLVLDGLSVTMELINDIITSDSFSVRLLSVVGCRNLNEGHLQQLLRYICRPERPEGSPRLKGIYVFPKRTVRRNLEQGSGLQVPSILSATGAQLGGTSLENEAPVPNDEAWWYGCGQILDLPTRHGLRAGWEQTMNFCEGVISFDGILCSNKPHYLDGLSSGSRPLATVSLSPTGCASCGLYPQLQDGPLVWERSPAISFPLLSPLPHSGKLSLATEPPSQLPTTLELAVSCEDCLRDRWCSECNRYWCHECYSGPRRKTIVEFDENNREVTRIFGDSAAERSQSGQIKVFNGLCIEHCLVKAEMDGAGASGMWG